jgi:hypothetical protein
LRVIFCRTPPDQRKAVIAAALVLAILAVWGASIIARSPSDGIEVEQLIRVPILNTIVRDLRVH